MVRAGLPILIAFPLMSVPGCPSGQPEINLRGAALLARHPFGAPLPTTISDPDLA